MQYIADQAPHKNLAPANGTLARYRLQEWLNFIGTELHKGHSPLFQPNTPDAYKPIVREKLLSRFQWLDEQLAGKEWLMGEHFSVADGYLFTVSSWGKHVGVDLSGFQHLQAYLARVAPAPPCRPHSRPRACRSKPAPGFQEQDGSRSGPSLPGHRASLYPAHAQIERPGHQADHQDACHHEVGAQEVRGIEHHLPDAHRCCHHFRRHQRGPAETDGDAQPHQDFRQCRRTITCRTSCQRLAPSDSAAWICSTLALRTPARAASAMGAKQAR